MRVRLLPQLIVVVLLLGAAPAMAETPPGLAIPDGSQEVIVFPQPDLDTVFEDDFGYARSDGRTHQGNDLVGERGDPVVAILDGTIIRMRSGPRSGYYIVIDHDNGWRSSYMHLNNDRRHDDGLGGAATAFAPGLAVGQRVEAGELIGFVGDSGNAEATAPHTHFELHINGRAVDPHQLLLAAWDRYLVDLDLERLASIEHRGAE